jgi:2-methylisocitrate lyase-like PEP mutase family enzyme
MSPGERQEWLRSRLQCGPLVLAPGVFDALSARLVERCGFEVAYGSQTSTSAAMFRRGLEEEA